MKSQEKAERSVQVTRLKAQKLEEIERLKQIELEQRRLFEESKGNRESLMKKVIERVNSIGSHSRKQIPIEPVFDNAIEAIKLRIKKQQHMEALENQKRVWALENEQKRNGIIAMEEALKESLKKTRERNLERIKSSQTEHFHSMQKRIKDKCTELKKLTNIEQKLLKKLKDTQAIESRQFKNSVKSLKLLKHKSNELDEGGNSETNISEYIPLHKPE